MLLVRNLDPFVPELSTTSANPVPVRVERLKNSLETLQFKLQRSREDGDVQNNPASPDLAKVRMTLGEVLELLRARPLSQVGLALDSFQDKLFQDFVDTWVLLRDNLHPSGPLTLADIPPQLRNRFVSADETQFLLQIYPRQDIWEWKPLSEFVTQLRQVDPTVTGSPVIGYESIRTITHGYFAAGFYATAAMLMVVLLTMGGLRLSGLVMLPVVLGLLWTVGFMWILGLKLNLANLVAIPITIGLGVESGMYFVRRASKDKAEGWQLVSGSTGQAVAVFSLSTMVSFGSLMVASHYGIFSMGLLLTVAVGSVLLASLVVLPLFLSTNQRTIEVKSMASSLSAAPSAQDLVENGEDRSLAHPVKAN